MVAAAAGVGVAAPAAALSVLAGVGAGVVGDAVAADEQAPTTIAAAITRAPKRRVPFTNSVLLVLGRAAV
jgi:hypothetical protein